MDEAYYIRPADSEQARGPFDVDKLATLADAGQVTRETLYYDDTLEAWATIGSNRQLAELVFPSKKRLSLRDEPQKKPSGAQVADDQREVLSVEAMLAAAEGQTEETHYLKEEIRWQHRAASLAIPTLATVCFISALTFIYPSWTTIELILNQDPDALAAAFQKPLLILGILDLFFGFCLVLAATEIYPLLRFRAMLGLGFFGYFYWASMVNGESTGLYLALASVAYGIGIFVCTLTLRFRVMVSAALLSLTGAIIFGWFTTLRPLLLEG